MGRYADEFVKVVSMSLWSLLDMTAIDSLKLEAIGDARNDN